MGTMLYAKGIYINTCFDELNLTGPGLVREVHAEYVKAGVDIIETNTFGANRFKLKKYGLDDKVAAINGAGVTYRPGSRRRGRPRRRLHGPAWA